MIGDTPTGSEPGAGEPPEPDRTLEGRGAVVTGGGRGVGASIARALAGAGARVVVAARTAEEIESVAEELRGRGAEAHAIHCDVADADSVEALARDATERLGSVSILVNGAGISHSAPLGRTSLEDWNRLLAVNATGTFLCVRAFLPGMLEGGWGRVVNLASVAGLAGGRYISAYAASKHAVVGLTRCAAAESAGRGVTVNAVCPGYLDTDMTRETVRRIARTTGRSEEAALRAVLDMSPQGRLIPPEEVAHAVLFLCHDHARAVNGETLVMDGGGLLA